MRSRSSGLQGNAFSYKGIGVISLAGKYGASVGVQIRRGYPHIAMLGSKLFGLEATLAHELTHVALQHLSMPFWLEEGFTQMFEHRLTGRQVLEVGTKLALRHKKNWSRRGLNAFWQGDGFVSPGKIQELSYQLAEILNRLLVAESQPRWFGWVREPQRRFLAFVKNAKAEDCGEAACREHLGYDLGDLAAKFLGPGDWSPKLEKRDEPVPAEEIGDDRAIRRKERSDGS